MNQQKTPTCKFCGSVPPEVEPGRYRIKVYRTYWCDSCTENNCSGCPEREDQVIEVVDGDKLRVPTDEREAEQFGAVCPNRYCNFESSNGLPEALKDVFHVMDDIDRLLLSEFDIYPRKERV